MGKQVTCQDLIFDHMEVMGEKHRSGQGDNSWCIDHLRAMFEPDDLERITLGVVYFLASYADAYYRTHEQYISEDNAFGPCWLGILANLWIILFGGTGRLDRKTLDDLLVDIAVSQGFDAGSLTV